MTPRSIRRAVERHAQKQALKAARNQALPELSAIPASALEPESAAEPLETDSPLSLAAPLHSPPQVAPPAAVISPARLAANRANAQLSTGARTPEGKTRSSLNAVKSALTGRTVLLPSDDVADYEALILEHKRMYRPANYVESMLVQSIVDCLWRLARTSRIEMTIFAQGRDQFAPFAAHLPESQRAGFLDRHTAAHYEKDLRNLNIQENRLARRRDKEIAELKFLQAQRVQREKVELEMAAKLYLAAKSGNQPFDPASHGFEFSIAHIEKHVETLRSSLIAAQSGQKEIFAQKVAA